MNEKKKPVHLLFDLSDVPTPEVRIVQPTGKAWFLELQRTINGWDRKTSR